MTTSSIFPQVDAPANPVPTDRLQRREKNIVLTGMTGSGKSTVGAQLATQMAFPFLDTDALICRESGMPLQEIMEQHGLQCFRELEEQILLALRVRHTIIATGGSVVYSQAGMDHLHEIGIIFHLFVPLEVLESRLLSLDQRGVVNPDGLSFAQLYAARLPLYQRHADHTINCGTMPPYTIATVIRHMLQGQETKKTGLRLAS